MCILVLTNLYSSTSSSSSSSSFSSSFSTSSSSSSFGLIEYWSFPFVLLYFAFQIRVEKTFTICNASKWWLYNYQHLDMTMFMNLFRFLFFFYSSFLITGFIFVLIFLSFFCHDYKTCAGKRKKSHLLLHLFWRTR